MSKQVIVKGSGIGVNGGWVYEIETLDDPTPREIVESTSRVLRALQSVAVEKIKVNREWITRD